MIKFSDIFKRFVATGAKPSLPREVSALLDESRSALLSSPAVADQINPEISAAEFINKAEAALAKRPSVIHATTDEYRSQQGRPPLGSGMQTAARPNPIFNPAPKPAAAKPAAPAAAAAPKPAATKPQASTPATQEYTEIDRIMGRIKPMKAIQPAPAAKAKPAPPAAPAKPPTPLNDAFAKLGSSARTNYLRVPGNRRALSAELTDAVQAESRAKVAAIRAKVNPTDAKKIAARKSLNS